MEKIIKFLLALILILGITYSWSFTNAEAKSNKVSYLMNKKNSYTYSYDWGSEKKRTTLKFLQTYYGNDEWVFGDFTKYCQETKKGLFVAEGPSIATQPSLKYPIKKNKKWNDEDTGSYYQIIEVNKKVKVKAGTFKNVVVVKETSKGNKSFFLTYYAPNVGDILRKYNEGKAKSKTIKQMELIKVKKR